ncbi:WD40 repeat domain-containing protein, partial [Zavarzinella formosa]|uniref:WD40 repeat domain-containing protein n=1 Tax=Zavarzinella formosa TaxID=360055 RepID=UPI00187D9981
AIAENIAHERIRTDDKQFVQQIAYSPDGKTMAFATGEPDGVSDIHLISIPNLKFLGKLQGHKKFVSCIQFSPDSKVLFSGGRDNLCFAWNLKTFQITQKFQGHNDIINSMHLTLDGKHLVICGNDNRVTLWNPQDNSSTTKIDNVKWVAKSIASFKDDLFAFGCDDGIVRIWNLKTNRELFQLKGHSGSIRFLVSSKDRLQLIVGSDDGIVKLWNISFANGSGNDIATWNFGINKPVCAVMIPGANQMAIGMFNGQVVVCSLSRDNLVGEIRMNIHDFPVTGLSSSPDGKTLASGSAFESNMSLIKNWPK